MKGCFKTIVAIGLSLITIADGETLASPIHATAEISQSGALDRQKGESFAFAHGATDVPGQYFQASSATSQGGVLPSVVLVTGSASQTNYSSIALGAITTQAVWRDSIILSGLGGATLPDFVELVFSSQGRVGFIGPLGEAAINVGGSAGGGGFSSTYGFGSAGDVLTDPSTWDQVSYGGGSFSGTWRLRVGLEGPNSSGERAGEWQVGYSTSLRLQGEPGRGAINGGDSPTFSFTAIRLVDGRTPEEAGLTVRFESGIASPNAVGSSTVPEPASLTVLGVGLVGLLIRQRLRRTPPQ